jgi:hypothetical protein
MSQSNKPQNNTSAPKSAKLIKGNKKETAPMPCKPVFAS